MKINYYAAVDIVGNPLYALTFSLNQPIDGDDVFFKPVTESITHEELLSKYWWDGEWKFRGEKPSFGVWTKVGDDWQWVINMEAYRASKLEYINAEYSQANLGTFEYAGFEFNADVVAQNNLNATAHYIGMFNEFPPDWLGVWLSADGASIPMTDLMDFKNLYKAFVAKGVANIFKFESLKSQILSSSTAAELDAVIW